MASDWKRLPLDECMEAIIDYRGKTPHKVPQGVPLVTAKIVKGGKIGTPDEYVAEEDYQEWMRRGLPLPGDVVMTTEAPLGEVAQLGHKRVALAQRIITLRGKKGLVDNTYLKFLMQSPAVQEQLHARSTGTTVLGIKQRELRKIMLQLPPLSEQKAIARILGSLDEKIELNRRMNETLEGIADALFESWFVDFDPVRAKSENREVGFPKGITAMFPDTLEDSEIGEIPSGWQTRRIDELATINGLMLRKEDPLETVEYIEISEVLKGEIAKVSHFDRGQEPSRARRRLRHGDTVLSTVRPDRKSFFLCLNPPPNLIASTGFAVISPVEAPWSWIHAALTRDEVFSQLGRHADGGAYPAVRPEILGSYQTCWPSRKEPPELFHRLAAPLYEQAQRNRAESKTLTALRDSLLPRLFSGELRVATILRAGASAT